VGNVPAIEATAKEEKDRPRRDGRGAREREMREREGENDAKFNEMKRLERSDEKAQVIGSEPQADHLSVGSDSRPALTGSSPSHL
jgi:hypothetical protein